MMAKFQPGHPKLGGRKKGTPNKKKVLRAEQVMAEMDYNPVREMILQAQNPDTPPDIKAKLNQELNKLLNPPAKEQPTNTDELDESADDNTDPDVLMRLAESK
jgi:hypothetical protein